MASESVEDNTWAQEGDGYQVEGGNEDIKNSDNAQDINLSVPTAPQTSGDSASIADGASEDVGEYDPESVTVTPLPQQGQQNNLKPVPQPAAAAPKKRKTAGGFLVGDSDSEDDASAAPSNGLPAEQAHTAKSLAHSPLRKSSAHEAQGVVVSNVPPASQANNAPIVPVEAPPAVATPVAAAPQPYNPQDAVTTLEERIKKEPRAAMDAWLALMSELRRRDEIEQLRNVYERFLAVFPQAADVWTEYMELELDTNNFAKAEDLFKRTLRSVHNVKLLTVYLDYIRRRNDLSDPTGRDTITQSFEFILSNDVAGVDRDSGPLWGEYIQFIKSWPGQVGEQDWESRRKMDKLRAVYQRAIAIPTRNLNTLWREYDQFELSLDKKLGRGLINQHSPNYMTAKSANMALDNITRGLQRNNLPRLPPAPGFEGDEEYMEQVELWKKWIDWEKSDPLELRAEDPATMRARIFYVYKQALMALRFWPEMWVDAVEWCWENNIVGADGDQGLELLVQGIDANPESVLLALKHADRIEGTYPVGEGDEAKADRGNAVKAPYVKVLDTLYELIKSLKDQEKTAIDKTNEMAASFAAQKKAAGGGGGGGDDDDDAPGENAAKDSAKQAQIRAIQQGFSAQNNVLSKTISYVWIAVARAMRRVQGKGAPNTPIGGMRQVFTEARARGKLTSDVYVAIALMEWKVYKDNAGVKIFERGARLFPEDEYFMVQFLKFLHSRDDFTNARVVFENCVKRLTEKPGSVQKARALFSYFHKYESQYGDRSQIVKLEQRMAELFPDDPRLNHFKARFTSENFDPITARVIVSPSAQLRPKNILPSIEQRASVMNSPRPSVRQQNSPQPQFMPSTNSPKRPRPFDEFEDSLNPPRKLQRGESPLKGAAGRRLDQQRRTQAPPISRDITFLLGQIPSASSYTMPRFSAVNMVRLLRDTHVPDIGTWKGNAEKAARGVPSHSRQISGSVSQFPYQGRETPGAGRPQSPFDVSRGRMAPAASTYRQSSLRPGSSGSGYEPPPPAFGQNPMPTPFQTTVMAAAPEAGGAWMPPQPVMYGGVPASDYAVPSPYGQAPPPQQQPPYGRYY